MADFIEREALKADLQESYEGLKNIYKVLKHDEERRIAEAQFAVITEAILRVKDAPAADVVEVVRCKDCVSSRPINMEYWVENAFYKECVWCQWFDTGMLPDEYCSYGKRKMDKEE